MNNNKNGKFVGNVDIPFTELQRANIEAKMDFASVFFGDAEVFLRENGLQLNIDIVFGAKSNKTKRDPATKSSLKLTSDRPTIHLYFRNQSGYDEVTREAQTQLDCFVRTFGFAERGYRKKHWETFGGYDSFDFGFDVDTIWNGKIFKSIEQIYDTYKGLI